MTFTDPPYNVNYGETMKDKLRKNSNKIINDNLGDAFEPFLEKACKNMLDLPMARFIFACLHLNCIPCRKPLSPPVATGQPLSSGPRTPSLSDVLITSASMSLFSMAGEKESTIIGAGTATREMFGK